MSSASAQQLVTEYLPEAIESDDLSLTHIKYAFLAGLAIFVLLLPFCCSRKSFFDALAARHTLWFARVFIFTEMLLIFCLYYFYFEHGEPVRMHKYLAYGNGESWLYSFGRPTAGLVFIGVGMLGEVHPVIRFLCMIGCMVEIMGDALSAYQVRDYYRQVTYHSAPRYGYTSKELLAYYWRDIFSIAACTAVFMLTALLTVMMGFWEPQFIHPSLVSGKDLDRYTAMRNSKDQRKIMAMDGLLGVQKDHGLAGVLKARQQVTSLSSKPASAQIGGESAAAVNTAPDIEEAAADK
jgi:hypothetical protein